MVFRFLFVVMGIIGLQSASGTAHAATFRLFLEPTDSSNFAVDGFFEMEITDDGVSLGQYAIDVAGGDIGTRTGTFPIPAITYSSETRPARFNRIYGIIFDAGLQPVPGMEDRTRGRQLRLRLSTFDRESIVEDLTSGRDIDSIEFVQECFNCTPSRGTNARLTWTSTGGDTAPIPIPASVALSLGGIAALGSLRFGRKRS